MRNIHDPETRSLHITGGYYVSQFKQMLPQMHLTLVSILQSLALGALLINFGQPRSAMPADLVRAFFQHTFYLPQLASFLIIVDVWFGYMFAVFSLPWPLSNVNNGLQILVVVPEVAAFSSVNQVGTWVLWVGIIGLIGAVILVRNPHIVSPELFRQPGEETKIPALFTPVRENASLRNTWPFWVFGLLLVIGGYVRDVGLLPPLLGGTLILPFGISLIRFDVLAPLVIIVGLVFGMRNAQRRFAKGINLFLSAYDIPYHINEKSNRLEVGLPPVKKKTNAGSAVSTK
jgi:hypothetical protein